MRTRARHGALMIGIAFALAVSGCGGTSSGASSAKGSPASASPSAKAHPLIRKHAKTAIGDPATAEMCSILAGLPVVKGMVRDYEQEAGGCTYSKDGASASVVVQAYAPGEAAEHIGADADTLKQAKVHGIKVDKYAPAYNFCDRVIHAKGVDIRAAGNTCAQSDAVTDAVTKQVASGKRVARRPVPPTTITRYDLCNVIRKKRKAMPKMPGGPIDEVGFGTDCELAEGLTTFDAWVESVTSTPKGWYEKQKLGKHTFYRYAGNNGSICSVLWFGAVQNKQWETLYFDRSAHGTSQQQTCHTLEQQASAVLDGLHVR